MVDVIDEVHQLIPKGFFGYRLPSYYALDGLKRRGRAASVLLKLRPPMDLEEAIIWILRVQNLPVHPCLDSLHYVVVDSISKKPTEIYMTYSFLPNLNDFTKNNMKHSEVFQVIGEVVMAIEHLHLHKITHNDVCAENIFVKPGGGSILSGFEKCRDLEEDEDIMDDFEALAEITKMLYDALFTWDDDPAYLTNRDMLAKFIADPPYGEKIEELKKEARLSISFGRRKDFIKLWDDMDFEVEARPALKMEQMEKLMELSKQANLVNIYGYEYVDNVPVGYLMGDEMSLKEGMNMLSKEGIEKQRFAILAEHIALAIQFLAISGFVHGAIRPDNVVFSSAKCFQLCSLDSIFAKTRDTRLAYLAPELFHSTSRSKDPRADIYSYGMLLATVKHGGSPYSTYKGTSTELARAILNGSIRPFQEEESMELIKGCCQPLESRWSIEKILEELRDLDEEVQVGEDKEEVMEPPWLLPIPSKEEASMPMTFTSLGKTYSRDVTIWEADTYADRVDGSFKRLSGLKDEERLVFEFKRLAHYVKDPFTLHFQSSIKEIFERRQKDFNRMGKSPVEDKDVDKEESDENVRRDQVRVYIHISSLLENGSTNLSILRYEGRIWVFVDDDLKECHAYLPNMQEIVIKKGGDIEEYTLTRGSVSVENRIQIRNSEAVMKGLFHQTLCGGNELTIASQDKRYGPNLFFHSQDSRHHYTSRTIEPNETFALSITTKKIEHRVFKLEGPIYVSIMFCNVPYTSDKSPLNQPTHRVLTLTLPEKKRSDVLFYLKNGFIYVIQDSVVKDIRAFEQIPMYLVVQQNYHTDYALHVEMFSGVRIDDKFAMECWPREIKELGKEQLERHKKRYEIRNIIKVNLEDVSEMKSIGDGNFANVCKGRCSLGLAAFKIQKMGSEAAVVEEIQSLMMLNDCPHFVEFLAVLKSRDKVVGIVLELMKQDLAEVIQDLRIEYDDTHICHWMIQIAEGLEFLHERGLVHRDVKPANLLVKGDNYEQVKLGDLGALTKQNLTTKRQNTPKYCDPLISGMAGTRVRYPTSFDIFSLGVTLWDVFHRSTLNEMYPSTNIARRDTRNIDWTDVIERCTSEHDLRPTASDLSHELKHLHLSLRSMFNYD